MEKKFFITVSRRLQKVSPSCSTVKLSLKQRYEFENVFDLFTWLDQFRLDQKNGILQIKTVRAGSTFLIWSIDNNLPLGWSLLDYIEWQNILLRAYLLDN